MGVRQEISDYLLSQGFVREDAVEETFVRTSKQVVGRTIINNQVTEQTQDTTMQFAFVGEGSIDDTTPIYGYSLKVNDVDVGDLWVSESQQFIGSYNL